jgi:arabinose-5-phosphate isomerase
MSTPEAGSGSLIAAGRRTLEIEYRAVQRLADRIDESFAAGCRLCLAATGRVVVTGLGKSGHIGSKIAATLASTGTPSFFLHATEASHGDLGMVARGDVVIAISHSGETAELLSLLPHLRRIETPVIAMTGRPASTLAREAQVHLDVSVLEEACPLNLAPTASTTATLAMGDALATALLEARGFTAEDFARSHPAGALGRKLLLHVADVMRVGEELPRVNPDAPLGDGLVEMSRKGLGLTAIVDGADTLLGVFTDGDLRRAISRGLDLNSARMRDVMTANPKCVEPRLLAAEAVNRMQEYRVNSLLVTEGADRLVGALNTNDLLRAGVV